LIKLDRREEVKGLCVRNDTTHTHTHVRSRSTQPSIPQVYVNRAAACLAGVNMECVHLCRAAGNTV